MSITPTPAPTGWTKQRGWITPAHCNLCGAETMLTRGISGYLLVSCSKFREREYPGRGTGYEGLSFVPEVAPAGAPMVGASAAPLGATPLPAAPPAATPLPAAPPAATPLAAAPLAAAPFAAVPLAAAPLAAGASLTDALREGAAAAPTAAAAAVPTVDDSEQMERALHARLQQSMMEVLHMTEAQVTSLLNHLQSDRPMEHAGTIWNDIHKEVFPEEKGSHHHFCCRALPCRSCSVGEAWSVGGLGNPSCWRSRTSCTSGRRRRW